MENVCRTCLRIPDNLLYLFDDVQLLHKIAVIANVEISTNDNLPSKICEECIKNVNLFYNFRKVIRNSDLELRERYAALERNSSIKGDDESLTNFVDVNLEVKNENETEKSEEVNINNTLEPESNVDTTKHNEKTKKCYNFKNILTYRKKTYQCKNCDFSCTEISKWINHKRTKHYPRAMCNICGKSMRNDNLHKHMKSHSDSPVSCTECGKVFKNSESLRAHSFIHKSPDVVCDLCGKIYKYRGEYNRHIKRHSLNGEKTVKCPLCDKMFHEKKHVKKHMQTHTGERPYTCQYCHKGFSSGYALKTHIRQHTNEKPYICEYCPMAFPQKVSLMTHIKSKHSVTST